MKNLKLFGFTLVNAKQEAAIAAVLSGPERATAYFMNAHCVNVAANNPAYAASLKAGSYLLPDGSGISLAARMTGQHLEANLNGTDLFLPLCAEAARRGKSIFLLGAEPGIAEAAARNAQKQISGLKIAGSLHGFFDPAKANDVIEQINASGADILLVAMGVPMQELWINQHRDQLTPELVMGVGALFDFHSGSISRAPNAVRRLGCEWLWRLAMEPRRLAHRYLVGNPMFVLRATRHAAQIGLAQVDSNAILKRTVDLGGTGLALLGLLPVFLLVAAAIRAESSGPVFYRQTRVGRDGRTFSMLKFRSMYRDADARRAALLESSDRTGLCFKSKADPRITRVGRVLRRFSLDELPQLLNVLRGNMSMVGPRPALPEEVAGYPEAALGRLAVKPGITGLWQIAGRADIGFEKMIDMDLAYVRSRSILLDLVILALTGRAVVSGRGAY